jgi:hypothetical protein
LYQASIQDGGRLEQASYSEELLTQLNDELWRMERTLSQSFLSVFHLYPLIVFADKFRAAAVLLPCFLPVQLRWLQFQYQSEIVTSADLYSISRLTCQVKQTRRK